MMPSRTALATAICFLIFLCATAYVTPAFAQPPAANEMPSVIQVPAEAQPSPHFDATAATNAYLAQIPADKLARSNAYFEGGYWLILWDFLYGVVVALLLLNLRWSARMRDLAERVTRFKPIQTFVYWLEYLVLTTVLVFPLTVYEDYFREHKYGLATQTFGPWMGDQLKSLAVVRCWVAFWRCCCSALCADFADMVDLGRGGDHCIRDLHGADLADLHYSDLQ